MGPGIDLPGKLSQARPGDAICLGLQWGPGLISRERIVEVTGDKSLFDPSMGPGIDLPGKRVRRGGALRGLLRPSMGPGIDLPGKASRSTPSISPTALQWGPGLISRERLTSMQQVRLTLHLQWGPGLISRERRELLDAFDRRKAPSMGPGIDLPGKGDQPSARPDPLSRPSMGPGIDLPGKKILTIQ